MTGSATLPSNNEAWGFYGTIRHHADPAAAWPLAMQAIGEATPFYLQDPEAPARIKKRSPDARVLVSLRDPVERLHSHYLMMRNNLRVLEQKLNSSESLSAADKFDWQQYVTRCYGSMTTFNVLFQEKEDQF